MKKWQHVYAPDCAKSKDSHPLHIVVVVKENYVFEKVVNMRFFWMKVSNYEFM